MVLGLGNQSLEEHTSCPLQLLEMGALRRAAGKPFTTLVKPQLYGQL